MFSKKSLIIFILVGLVVSGYIYFRKKNKKQIQYFQTTQALQKDLKQYVNASRNLKARDEIIVGSLVAGRIIKILAEDNDFVTEGTILAELDDGKNYSGVKRAQALLAKSKAQKNYYVRFVKRQEAIYKAGQLSQNAFEEYTRQLETAVADVVEKQAQVEIADQEYHNLFIKSPANGIVIAKKVSLGQMITSILQATELFVIAKDLHFMEVNVDVDEADVGMVKEGQTAHFTVDAFPRHKFAGKVTQVRYLAKIVENVVTYAAIIEVDNPNLKLRPGMTADIYIKVAGATNAFCVPNKALRVHDKTLEKIARKLGYKYIDESDKDLLNTNEYLWIVENKIFKKVPVTFGINDGRHTQILSGIDENTVVLSEAYDPNEENLLLKAAFKSKSGIG